MKIVIFGATGGAGRELMTRALAAGHEVTAVARDPASITTGHDKLRVVTGDVGDAGAVAAAIAGQDAVVCTVGPRPGTPPGTLISGAVRHILAGMAQHEVRRFVFVSGLMQTDARHLGFFKRTGIKLFRALNRALYDDKVIAEQAVRASSGDWVIVRPPSFGAVTPRGRFRIGVDLDVKLSKMANADVADALLAALTDAQHTRTVVEISY